MTKEEKNKIEEALRPIKIVCECERNTKGYYSPSTSFYRGFIAALEFILREFCSTN